MNRNIFDFPEETTALFDSDLQAEKRANQLAILALNKRIDLIADKVEKLMELKPLLEKYNESIRL
jgi:hypothetical protein